jgi:hypothetical protein
MMTEFLGFLIIVGAILVVVFRHQFRKGTTHDLQETGQLAISTDKFRRELERSGNEIIQRLDGHINRLEQLIVEADKRAAMLDARLHELDRMAPSELERTDAKEFSQILRQSVDIADKDKTVLTFGPEADKADREGQEQTVLKDVPLPDNPEMIRVKGMIRQGCSDEEISRATNIGRNAIELMRQMVSEH